MNMKHFSVLFLVSLNLLNAGDSNDSVPETYAASCQNNYIHPETGGEVRCVIASQITGGTRIVCEIQSRLPRHPSQSPKQKGYQDGKHEEPSDYNQPEKKN